MGAESGKPVASQCAKFGRPVQRGRATDRYRSDTKTARAWDAERVSGGQPIRHKTVVYAASFNANGRGSSPHPQRRQVWEVESASARRANAPSSIGQFQRGRRRIVTLLTTGPRGCGTQRSGQPVSDHAP